MLRSNSSIFSSESKRVRRLRAVLATLAWTVLSLAVMDFCAGRLAALPPDIRTRPGSIAQYFDYGTSTDRKIARMLGPDDAHSAPILSAGWIARDCSHVPASAPKDRRGLTIYGMSFTNHIADQLEKIDSSLAITRFSGPEASPNHSYACFQSVQRAGRDPNDVQVLGVLASSLPRMLSLSGATSSFEQPMPFTFPRYEVDGRGHLVAVEPIVRSPEDMRNPAKWAAFKAQLAGHDAFYDPALFGWQWADHSVFLRLIRRAYGQAEFRSRYYRLVGDDKQFRDDLGPPLRGLLVAFTHAVRARGQRPFIILLQDSGGADSLDRLVGSLPEQAGATIIRSEKVADVNDPRSFLPDGHFTPRVDRLIAQQLLAAINNPAK